MRGRRNIIAFLLFLLIAIPSLAILFWWIDTFSGAPSYVNEAAIAMAGGIIGGGGYVFWEKAFFEKIK